MEQIDFAYFVGDPRRKKDLVSLHLANREDPFRVKAAIPLHPIEELMPKQTGKAIENVGDFVIASGITMD